MSAIDQWIASAIRRRFPALGALLVAVTALFAAGAQADRTETAAGRDSADRIIFWLGCDQIARLTDAQLDEWKSSGVDGFVCMVGHLRGMGGTQNFTGDPKARLRGDSHALQRRLRNTEIGERARDRGMKLYLGAKLVNYSNRATPLRDWFDDRGWRRTVLPRMSDLAAAAKLLGFAGLAFDQELYPQRGNVESATWDWDYPGNTHSEAQVRAKAKQRGGQLMRTLLEAFPGIELTAYDVQFPETWEAVVQGVVNDEEDAYAARLDIDFWDGLTNVEGYSAIRLVDAIFYKSSHLETWDSALRYNAVALAGLLSRRFSNWGHASSRVFLSPFSWIDPGPGEGAFDDARSPDVVLEQLLAFRKWGMGGEFANYVFDDHLSTFDFSPYIDAIREASRPTAVDSTPPTLQVSSIEGSGRSTRIQGTVDDNLAVWAVRWRDDRGRRGAARLRSQILVDPFSDFALQTSWQLPARALAPGVKRVKVTAQDIKGHLTSRWIRIPPG